jgi:RecA-family ATPase
VNVVTMPAVDFGAGEQVSQPRRWARATDVIDLPTPAAIVEGLVWEKCLTVVTSESGVGKTFVVLDLGAHISSGLEWHGRGVQVGSVVYVYFEGHPGLRLKALREVGGHWLSNLFVVDASRPLSPAVDRDRVEVPSLGELELAAWLDEIVAATVAESLPPVVLVIFDTIRASLAGSEDSSEAVSAYLRAVRRLLTHTPQAAGLLVHHAGWQDGESRKKRERGSSAFRGNVDASAFLDVERYDPERHEARLTLTQIKVRDGETLPPLHLIRRRVEIPGFRDRWGQPVTSCLIDSDRRTREERDAETTRETQAVDREQDRALLRIIREHPEATSQRLLRALTRTKSETFNATLDGLILAGLVIPPPKQRTPYMLTPAGLAALEAE